MFSSSFDLHPFTNRLLFWLSAKVLFLCLFILYANLNLSPDEAQYWTWSQFLDWGYYSKPPGIAWQIWLSTSLFGQTELGVRALSLIFSFFQALLIYQIGCALSFKRSTAYVCGLTMAFCPIGVIGSLLAITDGGFLLMWTIAIYVVVQALEKQKIPSALKVGLCMAIGALFKWPIYLFWIFYLIARQLYFKHQSFIHCLGGFLLSFIGLLPSLLWNSLHNWVTFRHTFTILQGGNRSEIIKGNFFEFMGAQIALFSPLLFALVLYALYQAIKERKNLSPSLFFCTFTTCLLFAFGCLLSLQQKVQGNWLVFIYPTAIILMGWACGEKTPALTHWIKKGVCVSLLFLSMLGGAVLLTAYPQWNTFLPFYKKNPFKHNLGWQQLETLLQQVGYQANQHFLVSDKYQTTSLLSFYAPDKKRAYFLNLTGTRNNQFTYWPTLQEEQRGKNGFFVWVENISPDSPEWLEKQTFYQKNLPLYFTQVISLGAFPLILEGSNSVKTASVFWCVDCKDTPPTFSHLY